MADCMKNASEALHQLLVEGLGRLVAEGKIPAEPIPAFRVEVPADKSHGDFAANVAMVSAKTFRMAPRKIAELLLDAVSLDGTIFDRAEIAGPGFMNFFLQQKWFADGNRSDREGKLRQDPDRRRQACAGGIRFRQPDRTDARGQRQRRRTG